jgi:hypothetical protein
MTITLDFLTGKVSFHFLTRFWRIFYLLLNKMWLPEEYSFEFFIKLRVFT